MDLEDNVEVEAPHNSLHLNQRLKPTFLKINDLFLNLVMIQNFESEN